MPAPQLGGGPEPVVALSGRHLDVHYGHVGPVSEALPEQVVRVPRLGHHLEARVPEQPRDSLAQQHVVLTDHDP